MTGERSRGFRVAGSIVVLLLLTETVYLPFSVLTGKRSLFGWDYQMLHLRRLAFAREALLSWAHTLPAWSPRELMGAPFAANLQSFSWIPTHWLLLAFDPEHAYAVAIVLAAGLAAVFTFAYCRQLGLGQIASIAAGWTFACAGFFAARVEVGHLSLLEAYPALPMLLLAVERAATPDSTRTRRRKLAVVAVAAALLAVAGHPQVPAYSFGAALLYTFWRAGGWLRAQIAGALVLGVGASAAIWWPMLELIRRSTRVLPLKAASNDIVLPYHRLLALFQPGIDGWPAGVTLAAGHPFSGYPHPSYFWDTVAYIGILPWIVVAALVVQCVVQKRLPPPRGMFFAVLALGSLLAALPLLSPLRDALPGTFLRSPARLLYLVTFSLAMALGAGVDFAIRWARLKRAALAYVAIGTCLALHGLDLASFTRLFLIPVDRHEMETPGIDRLMARERPSGRLAVSRGIALQINSRYDDAGGFDSIFLADPYRAFVALGGGPPGLNEEVLDASLWPLTALRAASVDFVITPGVRPDLELVESSSGLHVYRVANAAPRMVFVPENNVRFTSDGRIPSQSAQMNALPESTVWLASSDRSRLKGGVGGGAGSSSVRYSRPSSDEIMVHVAAAQPGLLYVVESADPGWRARADGAAVPIVEANGFGLAIPLGAGNHDVQLIYRTPGRSTGAFLSLGSVILLAGLIRISGTRPVKPTPGG